MSFVHIYHPNVLSATIFTMYLHFDNQLKELALKLIHRGWKMKKKTCMHAWSRMEIYVADLVHFQRKFQSVASAPFFNRWICDSHWDLFSNLCNSKNWFVRFPLSFSPCMSKKLYVFLLLRQWQIALFRESPQSCSRYKCISNLVEYSFVGSFQVSLAYQW